MSEHHPQPEPARHPDAERRSDIRYLCRPDTLHATVDGDPWLARVRNISIGGISLIISRDFEPGTLLQVHLVNNRKRTSRQLQVRVVYTVEQPDGEWILGGALVNRLSGEDLRALL